MVDFERTLIKVEEAGGVVAYFMTKCCDCEVAFYSRTIGKMPEWEHEHQLKCEALEALEA